MMKFKEMNSVEKASYLNDKFWVIDGKLYHQEPGRYGRGFNPVGSVDNNGYLTVRVAGSMQKVHRCIYAMHHGFMPENDIDHVDGNKLNNRVENLQEASVSCNSTKSVRKIGVSGIRGIRQYGKSWSAGMNNGTGKFIHGKRRPTRGQALLDWMDMINEKIGHEACIAPQLQGQFALAARYKRIFGDGRTGSWDDKNKRTKAEKQSKIKGVSWYKDRGKWRASIRVNGKQKHLGYFTNEEDAIEALNRSVESDSD